MDQRRGRRPDGAYMLLVRHREGMIGNRGTYQGGRGMAEEYEHDGVIYHEPLPRILLVNFPSAFNEELASRGHNSTLCEEDSGPHIGLRFPKPANEVDIILVRDSNALAKSGTSTAPARTFHGGERGPRKFGQCDTW